jgi:hypothetical protein
VCKVVDEALNVVAPPPPKEVAAKRAPVHVEVKAPPRPAPPPPAVVKVTPEFVLPPVPPTASLTATATKVHKGESVKLVWTTENASDVQLEPMGKVDPTGMRSVAPGQTTDYILIASGPGGAATAKVRISLAREPIQVTIPAKTVVFVKLAHAVDTSLIHPGDKVAGLLAAPLAGQGYEAVPAGSPAVLVGAEVKSASHLGGYSEMQLVLSGVSSGGVEYSIASMPYHKGGPPRTAGLFPSTNLLQAKMPAGTTLAFQTTAPFTVTMEEP